MKTTTFDRTYWTAVSRLSSVDQVVHYSEVVETLAIEVEHGRLTALDAADELADAVTLDFTSSATGNLSMSALIAGDVLSEQQPAHAEREWKRIVYLSRVGSGRCLPITDDAKLEQLLR